MAKELLCRKNSYLYKYKRKYDMESFSYSLLDCVDVHYTNSFLKPVAKIDFKDFDPRNGLSSYSGMRERTMKSEHFNGSRFIELFFDFYDKLAEIPDDLVEENYTELRGILTSAKLK